jgi:hypothetical protein
VALAPFAPNRVETSRREAILLNTKRNGTALDVKFAHNYWY